MLSKYVTVQMITFSVMENLQGWVPTQEVHGLSVHWPVLPCAQLMALGKFGSLCRNQGEKLEIKECFSPNIKPKEESRPKRIEIQSVIYTAAVPQ